jgi:hypothetical protein
MTIAALAPFERDMIEYVISWAPYGDPPEDDCLPRFGKSFAHVQIRVRELVITGLQQYIKPDDRTLLVRVAILLGIPLQVHSRRLAVRTAPVNQPESQRLRCGRSSRDSKTTSTRDHANPPKLNRQ